jgi:antitoxin component YwqK of YwqJK toxin-antitoxin module
MRTALIGLFLLLVGAERQVVWAQESPQRIPTKIMPPVPKFLPRLPPAFQQNEKDQRIQATPSIPKRSPFRPPGERARTRIPSPFPRKPLDWSDFIYRSEQEKEFWEKLPDWSSIKEIASKPRDKNGEALPNDTVPGYTGYAKWRDHSHRMIFRLENGWTNKEMTWYRSGEKTSQISYLGGKRNGPALTWHQRRFRPPRNVRLSIPSPQSKPTPTKQASGWKDQNKKSEGNYKDDKKHGLWNFYDYEGNKSYSHTYAEGIEEGLFLSWHKNGNKREEGNHKKGKKHGLWTDWYENGRKMREGNHKDGKQHGPWIEWYENGQMMREDTHHGESYVTKAVYNPEGGKFGDEIQENSAMRDWTGMAIDISSRVDANGSAIKNSGAKGFDGYAYDDYYYLDEYWDDAFAVYEIRNGWIVKSLMESWDYLEESSYRNGSLDGPYKNWYWSGAKAEEGTYGNGLLKTASAWKPNGEKCPATRVTAGSGQLVKYDQQGNKTELLTYAGGKKEGPFVQWRANGQKKKEGSYGNEKLHGIEIHYYQDGNKSHIYTYKEGKKEGLFISWYKNGQKQEEVTHAESLMRDENSVPKLSSPLKIPRPNIPIPLPSGARHSSLASRFGPFRSWYENGILRTEGAYKRGNRDGTFSGWHSNGQKKEEGNYVDGKLDGPWIHYDQDGNKSHSYTYKEGKKEGLFISWYENGQKHEEITYSESLAGIKASPRRIPAPRSRNSSSAARFGPFRSWYENGLLKTAGQYKRGKLDGTFSSWHSNGQKKEEGNYVDGKLDGPWIHYDQDGNKSHSYTYKEGKKEGPFVQWHENGQKETEGNYKDGKQNGLWTDWHENGQKDEEGNYKDGKRNGLWSDWYEDGKKEREQSYKNGNLVSAVVWKPNGKRCPETKIDPNGDGIIVSYDENGNKKMETPFTKGRFRFVRPKKPVPIKLMPPVPKFRPPKIQNLSPLPNVSTPPKEVIRIPKPVAPKSEPAKMPERTSNSNEIDFNSLPPPPPPPNILPPSAPPPKTKSTHGEN